MRFDVSRTLGGRSIKGFNERRAEKFKSASSLQRATRAGTKAKEETFFAFRVTHLLSIRGRTSASQAHAKAWRSSMPVRPAVSAVFQLFACLSRP
jgi:hypothetical protein